VTNVDLQSTVAKAKEAFHSKTGIEIEDRVLYFNGRKLRDHEILKTIYPGRGRFVLDIRVISEGDTIEAGSSFNEAPSARITLGGGEDDITMTLHGADDDEWVDEPRSMARGQQRFEFGPGRQSAFRGVGQVKPEDVGVVVKELMERWTTVAD
jgi:hypothetical protein